MDIRPFKSPNNNPENPGFIEQEAQWSKESQKNAGDKSKKACSSFSFNIESCSLVLIFALSSFFTLPFHPPTPLLFFLTLLFCNPKYIFSSEYHQYVYSNILKRSLVTRSFSTATCRCHFVLNYQPLVQTYNSFFPYKMFPSKTPHLHPFILKWLSAHTTFALACIFNGA